MVNVEEVWARIVEHEGKEFRTKSGRPLTYEIQGAVFFPSRTDYQVSKADFEKALEHVPCDGPGALKNEVQGPAYVWAVLHDPRIRIQDW